MPTLSGARNFQEPNRNHWSNWTPDPGPSLEAEKFYWIHRKIHFIQGLRGDALAEYLEQIRWYAVPNDLVGGWCIMPVPIGPRTLPIVEIANFLSERNARYMVDLHNARLEGSD